MALILRDIRKERGLTQDQVASMSGLSKPFLSQMENGRRGYTVKTLRQVADALGIGIADLFDDAQEKQAVIMDQLSEAMANLDDGARRQVAEYAAFLAQKQADQQGA